NGLNVLPLRPSDSGPVRPAWTVCVLVWHSLHPTSLNAASPRASLAPNGAGWGGAEKRMKFADCSQAASTNSGFEKLPLGSFGSLPSPVLTTSFGCEPRPHASSSTFCVGFSSLVMPFSTTYASPAKTKSDLFCAFQPNLVIVPSLP